MTKRVELYFDFGSPTTYLAYHRLLWIEQNFDIKLHPIPVLLGGIFKATGNHSPVTIPLKAAWMNGDLQRYANLYGVPMEFNPHFPINTLYLMRGAIAAQHLGVFDNYLSTVFHAMWAEPVDMGDLKVVEEVLTRAGINAGEILEMMQTTEVKEQLKANTELAVARGVFGCPATYYEEELYFGQDRLFFVEQQLETDGLKRPAQLRA
jgi:2-hydroxychromene-2-carboxylate isomerase